MVPPSNTMLSPKANLMLFQRLRCWTNIKSAWGTLTTRLRHASPGRACTKPFQRRNILYKPWGQKGYFQFEIIIIGLVISF